MKPSGSGTPQTTGSGIGQRSSSLGKEESKKAISVFSPTNSSSMPNFFSKGPIKPTNLFQSSQPQQQQQREQLIVQQQQQQHQQQRHQDYQDDEYYGEEEGEEDNRASRMLSPQEEQMIIEQLKRAAQRNEQFLKVLAILQDDPELRPLIFEHENLLGTLIDIKELKAEQMLSILTAAETEMYENSKLNSQQQQQQQINQKSEVQTESKQVEANLLDSNEKEMLLQKTLATNLELEELRKKLYSLEQEKLNLTQELNREREERKSIEKEKECTFQNLYDENQMLKKLNETLKKTEFEQKKIIEVKEKEYLDELDALKKKLRGQEDLRVSMLQDKSKLEVDLKTNQNFIENLEKEIELLEKVNENLHRKMNSTLNSMLFQSYNHQFGSGMQNIVSGVAHDTPARRNLSTSFQNTALLERVRNDSKEEQKEGGFGQSTQKLKLLMSENKSLYGNSYIAHSVYYGLGGAGANQQNTAHYFQRGDSLVRSNSIDVILLDDEESKKQNNYPIGEQEKQPQMSSGMLANKQSWLKSKGVFTTELSPINSLSSQNVDYSSSRINQTNSRLLRKLHDVEEEQTEILGTHPALTASPYPTKFLEEQVKKLQIEIQKLKEENNNLTQQLNLNTQFIQMPSSATVGQNQLQTDESPLQSEEKNRLVFATPQNNNFQNFKALEKPQMQLTSNINPLYSNEQSPIMMATFSQEKNRQFHSQQQRQYQSQHDSAPRTESDDRAKFVEQYQQLQYEFASKLQELGALLISLFKMLAPSQLEVNHFTQQEFSISQLKHLIIEISSRLERALEQQSLSVYSNQPVEHQRIHSAGFAQQPFVYNPSVNQRHQNFFGPQSYSSNNYNTTMDHTVIDMKAKLVDEKEKRLMIYEELQKTKEIQLKFQSENEKLKQELFQERYQYQSAQMSQLDYQSSGIEQMHKTISLLQGRLDKALEENMSLNLKIADLESDLNDEKIQKQIKFDFSIQNTKNDFQGVVLDQKLRYDEQLMKLKQDNFELKTQIDGFIERNHNLNEQVYLQRERIQELEKENHFHSKENYVLQNELDYESRRASQLQNSKATFQRSQHKKQERDKLDAQISLYEIKIKELQSKASDWEMKAKKGADLEVLLKLRYEGEMQRLKSDNDRLLDEIRVLRASKHSIVIAESKQSESPSLKLNLISKRQDRTQASLMIRNILATNQKAKIIKSFYKFKMHLLLNQIEGLQYEVAELQKQKQLENEKPTQLQISDLEESSEKIAQLEEQMFRYQNLYHQISMSFAGMIRQINEGRPLKLSLSGMVSKLNIDPILSSMKKNSRIIELNFSKCELDDEDMIKVYESLKKEKALACIKIAYNAFTQSDPLLDLLTFKAKQLKQIDISFNTFGIAGLDKLAKVLKLLQGVEKLNISGIVNDKNNTQKDKLNSLIDALIGMPSLKSLDISNNKFQADQLNRFFYALNTNQKIEVLSVCNIGLNDDQYEAFLYMINNQKKLKGLNISGCTLSPSLLTQIINQLANIGIILDLDLTKCKLNNDQQCIAALNILLQQNKKLRSLVLSKTKLNDASMQILSYSLSNSPNIETLKLDFNEFSHLFIQQFCQQLKSFKNPQQPQKQQLKKDESESSFAISEQSFYKEDDRVVYKGLMTLDLEGNKIGDAGAQAIADVIKTPCENCKQLKHINMNECQITNIGFEELRDALQQRGNLAALANMSHIKITIERNNIAD